MAIKYHAAWIAAAFVLHAQDAAPRKNTYRSPGSTTPAARLVSPEVHADRTVTFRIRAPKAGEVMLSLQGSKPMPKDAAGLWSITVGPMEPELYEYAFLVDGARVLDVANTQLKIGQTLGASLVMPAQPNGSLSLRAL